MHDIKFTILTVLLFCSFTYTHDTVSATTVHLQNVSPSHGAALPTNTDSFPIFLCLMPAFHSVSVNPVTLGTSGMWSHSVCVLCDWLISLSWHPQGSMSGYLHFTHPSFGFSHSFSFL